MGTRGPAAADEGARVVHTDDVRWDISGDRFLVIYVVVLAAAALAGLAWRRWATTGSGTDDGTDRIELAFLNGGGLLACQVGLATLRRTGLVEPAELSTLVATGRLRSGTDPLTRALHHALSQPRSSPETFDDLKVRQVLTRLYRQLRHRGWLLARRRQRLAKLGALPMFGTAVFGLVRLGAGALDRESLGNPGDVAGLILLVAGTLFAGWALLSVSDVSRTGRRVLRRARRTNVALDPRRRAAWAERDVDELALAMALFGSSPLLDVDPEFASVLGIRKDSRSRSPRDFDTRNATWLAYGTDSLP